MLLELIQTLEDSAASSGIVTVLVDNLTKAIARVSNYLSSCEMKKF
jgi:ligand-binding sensor protein